MSDDNFRIDPTACGLFIVAAISLPLAMIDLWENVRAGFDVPALFMAAGFLLFIVALHAYRANNTFGYVVFVLAAFGVFLTGWSPQIGNFTNITFGLLYLMTFAWSLILKTPKTLSCVLLTTTLIFLLGGIAGLVDDPNVWVKIQGVVAIFNFLFAFYLGIALSYEGKVPVI